MQSRKAVVAWFADALLVNTLAEASEPDPMRAATPEFLMNVGVALLGLAMPIVRDEKKFAKVPNLRRTFSCSHSMSPVQLSHSIVMKNPVTGLASFAHA